MDRFLPGWSKGELKSSLDLVRDLMMPDWDIHPEMISHTRVIDLKTGRPLPPKDDGSFWMENGGWTAGRGVDEIAAYIAHALQILKNVGLPCEGFTTPGGFGNPAKANLVDAGREALIDVFSTEVPHYFKYVTSGKESNAPRVEQVSGLGSADPRFMVNVPSCTGDWFGGWDGVTFG